MIAVQPSFDCAILREGLACLRRAHRTRNTARSTQNLMDSGTIIYLLLILAFWLLNGLGKKKKPKRQVPAGQTQPAERNPTPFEQILRQMQEAMEGPTAPPAPPPAPKPLPAPTMHSHRDEDVFESDPVFQGDHFKSAEREIFDDPFAQLSKLGRVARTPSIPPIRSLPPTAHRAEQSKFLASMNLKEMSAEDLRRAFILNTVFGRRVGR